MKFCLIDVSNLVHRAKHAVKDYESYDDCVGMVLTIVFNSMRKSFDKFGADHCVACFDSYSWRSEIYPLYKAGRRDDSTPKEIEQSEIIKSVLSDLKEFLRDYTNVTVLDGKSIEADDFIGRWVQLHHDPFFEHVIISADGDFKQLVRDGVDLYNPITSTLYTINGVFYQDGKRTRGTTTAERYNETWKVKLEKVKRRVPLYDDSGEPALDGKGRPAYRVYETDEPLRFDPGWELFEKCMRGDPSDNIKSAFPSVKTKVLKEAYADRGGMAWNNLMFTIPKHMETPVRERYDFNRNLIDLTAQPDEIKEIIDSSIDRALNRERKKLIAAYFAKFCQKYRLNNLAQQASPIVYLLSKPYDEV